MQTKELKPQEISTRLYSMVGKKYRYANQLVTVKGAEYNAKAEEIIINTEEKGSYKASLARAASFLNFWHEEEGSSETTQPCDAVTITNTVISQPPAPPANNTNNELAVHADIEKMNTTADYLIEELKSSIAEVKKNPGYINQAKVINGAVGQILNVKKTQLAMYNALAPKKSNRKGR